MFSGYPLAMPAKVLFRPSLSPSPPHQSLSVLQLWTDPCCSCPFLSAHLQKTTWISLQPFSPRYPPLVSASNSFRHSLQNQEPHRSGKQADALQISTLLPLLQIQSPESSQLCSRLSAVGAPLLAPFPGD